MSSRAMFSFVTARRALWLRPWVSNPSSKQSCCKLLFGGKALFRQKLETAICRVTGGKSGMLPQDGKSRCQLGRSARGALTGYWDFKGFHQSKDSRRNPVHFPQVSEGNGSFGPLRNSEVFLMWGLIAWIHVYYLQWHRPLLAFQTSPPKVRLYHHQDSPICSEVCCTSGVHKYLVASRGDCACPVKDLQASIRHLSWCRKRQWVSNQWSTLKSKIVLFEWKGSKWNL